MSDDVKFWLVYVGGFLLGALYTAGWFLLFPRRRGGP